MTEDKQTIDLTYYRDQLNRIKLDEYITFKVVSNTASTNFLSLNKDSLLALSEFIKKARKHLNVSLKLNVNSKYYKEHFNVGDVKSFTNIAEFRRYYRGVRDYSQRQGLNHVYQSKTLGKNNYTITRTK